MDPEAAGFKPPLDDPLCFLSHGRKRKRGKNMQVCVLVPQCLWTASVSLLELLPLETSQGRAGSLSPADGLLLRTNPLFALRRRVGRQPSSAT